MKGIIYPEYWNIWWEKESGVLEREENNYYPVVKIIQRKRKNKTKKDGKIYDF